MFQWLWVTNKWWYIAAPVSIVQFILVLIFLDFSETASYIGMGISLLLLVFMWASGLNLYTKNYDLAKLHPYHDHSKRFWNIWDYR